jgi:GDPmannose 4,6-dehydratase
MAKKKALITGIAGQDGSYLSELLLGKDYEIHGTVAFLERNLEKIGHIKDRLILHECDATDREVTGKLVSEILPDEIYHLAAIATASMAPETEYKIFHDNLAGTHNILTATRDLSSGSKVFFAGSSLMFGAPSDAPQNEDTPINPTTPYGVAKTAGYFLTKMYRDAYKVFACTGILFNHESPRRSPEYVTRKITQAVSKIKKGGTEPLKVGSLDAVRDWGYAGDYVEAMWLMLQRDKPDDYVLATGKLHTVREFIQTSFETAGIHIRWQGNGTEEKGLNAKTGTILVEIDPKFYRPDETAPFQGDFKKAKKVLGWEPRVQFRELVQKMIQADLGS